MDILFEYHLRPWDDNTAGIAGGRMSHGPRSGCKTDGFSISDVQNTSLNGILE